MRATGPLPENFPVLPVAIPRANLSNPQDTGISPHGSAHAPVPFNRPNSLPTERGNHLLFINFAVKSVGRDFEDSRGARRDKPIHGHLWGFNVYSHSSGIQPVSGWNVLVLTPTLVGTIDTYTWESPCWAADGTVSGLAGVVLPCWAGRYLLDMQVCGCCAGG